MSAAAAGNSSSPLLAAKDVYVLLQPHVRVSRNARAQWLLRHLQPHYPLAFPRMESAHTLQGELGAVGAVPEDLCMPDDWDWDVAHLYRYRITPDTQVRFLSQRHRMVFMLDLSPSAATVSTAQATTAVERLVPGLRNALEGVVWPFYVPGSQLLLRPDLFVTVIAWTPFLASSDAQLVLQQGWPLTKENLPALLECVTEKLHRLEERIVHVNSAVQLDLAATRDEADRLMGGLFDASPPPPSCPSTPIATSEAGFVNMIKTGILALQLLPKNSSAGLYVVGDGSINLPDIDVCDLLLAQLRTKTISLSFLHVTSTSVPQAGLSRVPYNDFLNFIACSTYGSYLSECPRVRTVEYEYDMNLYHEAFFSWSFKKALQGVKIRRRTAAAEPVQDDCSQVLTTNNMFFQGDSDTESEDEEEDIDDAAADEDDRESGIGDDASDGRGEVSFEDGGGDEEEEENGDWETAALANSLLHRSRGRGDPSADDDDVHVRQSWEGELSSSLVSILSCRLREGYTVNEVTVSLEQGSIEVKLSLPWKIHSLIHYIIVAPWPVVQSAADVRCRVFVFLEGDYDTVHDIVCGGGVSGGGGAKKEEQAGQPDGFSSADRRAVVQKFFTSIQHLTRVDKLLVHLDSFSSIPANYQVRKKFPHSAPYL